MVLAQLMCAWTFDGLNGTKNWIQVDKYKNADKAVYDNDQQIGVFEVFLSDQVLTVIGKHNVYMILRWSECRSRLNLGRISNTHLCLFGTFISIMATVWHKLNLFSNSYLTFWCFLSHFQSYSNLFKCSCGLNSVNVYQAFTKI